MRSRWSHGGVHRDSASVSSFIFIPTLGAATPAPTPPVVDVLSKEKKKEEKLSGKRVPSERPNKTNLAIR